MLDGIVNTIIILFFLLILLYGVYGVWDSWNINEESQKNIYETYRPSENGDESFEKLRMINPEVIGWLTIYDTNIDYPLVQGENNFKYVNTDAKGQFALSGSIFLDYRNKKDFSDQNNIIYGHHMEKKTMFGELDQFQKESFFKAHRLGAVYYENCWHSIEFFAFLNADAYDTEIYTINKREQEDYIRTIKQKSSFFRELEWKEEEHFIMLSTCKSDTTNGRYVLVGRIKGK